MSEGRNGKLRHFDHKLFSAAFLEDLHQLKWSLKRKSKNSEFTGTVHCIPGGSGDFFGFHAYNHGEDLRYLDWHVYGRTNQLFVKDFVRESELHALVLVDTSQSMGLGTPKKLATALQIAAALSYLALQNACTVRLGMIKPKNISYSRSFYRMSQFAEVLCFLSWEKAFGRLHWHDFRLTPKRLKWSLFLCSDLLGATDGRQAIERIARKGHRVFIFHILSKEEISPFAKGEIRLLDVETGERRYCFFDEKAAENYQKAMDNFKKRWHNFFEKYKIAYMLGSSAVPVDSFLRPVIKPLGWI